MTLLIFLGFQILFSPFIQAIEIPEIPLTVMVQSPPPVIMFLIDDSTSMNDSILASSNNKVLSAHHYVFNDSENNILSSLTNPNAVIPPDKAHSWQARCFITNRMYYDPRQLYQPWPHWYTILNASQDKKHANPDCPLYHPMKTACQNLDNDYYSTNDFKLSYSHFFMFEDNNANEQLDRDEQLILVELSDNNIHSWEVMDPSVDITASNLLSIPVSDIPDSIALNASGQAMTYTNQRQNFANWFSFHRRKELAVKYHLGHFLESIDIGWIGMYSLNQSLVSSACLIDNTASHFDENKKNLLTQIYSSKSKGDSPLRQAYQVIGNYLDTKFHSIIGTHSPFNQSMTGDACRLAYAVVLTDGQYNGPSPNIGNRDCDGGENDSLFDGSFFSDPYENTFADVTMYYYERDLAVEIPNKTISEAPHQHLVPLVIHFSLSDLSDNIYAECPPNCPEWPKPDISNEQSIIIDLFHASINGRGQFFNANNPQALEHVIQKIVSHINDKQIITGRTALTGNHIQTESKLIKASFDTSDWTGDLKSYVIDSDNSPHAKPEWSAKNALQQQTDRNLITFNGQTGIPFRSDCMNKSDVSEDTINDMYKLLLGDIIHSSPLVLKNTVWIAANDSMVHAFDINTGFEKMAYIPGILWPRLHLLKNHASEHHYFIDGNLYYFQKNSYHLMCVTLGRGGKGLFCLNIGEKQPTNMPMWEYAPRNDPDLGYIQQAYIAESNYNNIPVIIFGNGFNSDNRQAYLYILNALTGKPLKWNGQYISKGIAVPASGTDNGLSSPALVDIDSNQTVDLIYAGDLQGNIWKFDCRSSDPTQWRIFFEDEHNNQACPIFQSCANNGQGQAVLIRPEVICHCDRRFMGYLILWGTGKYLEKYDIHDKSIQSLYCIWDWSDYWQFQRNYPLSKVRHQYLGPFTAVMKNHPEIRKPEHTPSNVSLIKRNISQADKKLQTMNWDPEAPQSHVGWFMDLSLGERVIFPFIYPGDQLFIVNTFTPDNSPCTNGGSSRVYMMNACNGQFFNELYKDLGMSIFCQSIEGILYPPLMQYSGSGHISLFFSSSILSEPMSINLSLSDINEGQSIFDGQLFYWKFY